VDIPFLTVNVMVHNAYCGFKGHCFFSSKVPDLFESVIVFLDDQLYGLEKSRSVLWWVDVWVGAWINWWRKEWIYRQTDSQSDGQTDRQTDKWMDGWMDGWIGR
jgi:hypothetical protein